MFHPVRGAWHFTLAVLFKSTAFLGAVALVATVWVYDASILVAGSDWNLAAIKLVAAQLPEGYGSKGEAALRLFGADRAFLLMEVMAAVKLLMLGIGYLFHLEHKHGK